MESNHAPDPRDPLIFQSVWQRVTAGQEDSPIALLPPPEEKTFPPVREAAPQLLLEGWMDRLAAAVRDTLALARRWPGPVSRLAWSQLRTLRNQLRRLDTGHFLLTGRRSPGTTRCANTGCASGSGPNRRRRKATACPALPFVCSAMACPGSQRSWPGRSRPF